MDHETDTRRRFLRRATAAALAVGVAGCGSDEPERTETETERPRPTETGTERPTRAPTSSPTAAGAPAPIVEAYGDRFGSIVDVVEAGADDTGAERIDDVLTDAIEDDTLLYFPGGEYRLGPLNVTDVRNVGLVSLAGDDTRIKPAVPGAETDEFINVWGVADVLLEGFEFDFTEKGYGGVVRLISRGDFVARDLRIRGKLPDWNPRTNHVGFRFDVRNADASGLVERVIARDGGHEGGNGVGIFVGKDHAGELVFRDCEIANFPNNGLYASAPGRDVDGYRGADGVVHVRGGRFENNNIANVRIGSTGSTVRNATVVVDRVPPSPQGALNVRGIRLRARDDQLVENCRIEIGPEAGRGFGAISYHPEHGSSTVRDTEIRVDRDEYNAISATDADNGGTERPLFFENVSVTGAASGGVAINIGDRPGTEIRGSDLVQNGPNRDGILFRGSDNCRVVDSTIRVTGTPIVTSNSSVERVNLSTERLAPDENPG